MKKIRNILILNLSCFALFQSCNKKITVLPDGWTRVTSDTRLYANRFRFSPGLLKVIDTNAIYRECCYLQTNYRSSLGSNAEKEYKTYSKRDDAHRSFYRFYNDGYCNFFVKDEPVLLIKANFNPDTTGFRGVFYMDKDQQVCVDLFTQTSGIGDFGVLKEWLSVSGDTLFTRRKPNDRSYRVFIKQQLPAELSQVKGWNKLNQ